MVRDDNFFTGVTHDSNPGRDSPLVLFTLRRGYSFHPSLFAKQQLCRESSQSAVFVRSERILRQLLRASIEHRPLFPIDMSSAEKIRERQRMRDKRLEWGLALFILHLDSLLDRENRRREPAVELSVVNQDKNSRYISVIFYHISNPHPDEHKVYQKNAKQCLPVFCDFEKDTCVCV